MNERVKAFVQKATEDKVLAKRISDIGSNLTEETKKEFLKIAQEYGYELSKEDLDSMMADYSNVSDDELKAVSGGAYNEWHENGKLMSSCWCAFGGGGSADQYQKTCACVFGGAGELTELGKTAVKNGQIHYTGSSSAPVAMWCSIGGNGHMGD